MTMDESDSCVLNPPVNAACRRRRIDRRAIPVPHQFAIRHT